MPTKPRKLGLSAAERALGAELVITDARITSRRRICRFTDTIKQHNDKLRSWCVCELQFISSSVPYTYNTPGSHYLRGVLAEDGARGVRGVCFLGVDPPPPLGLLADFVLLGTAAAAAAAAPVAPPRGLFLGLV